MNIISSTKRGRNWIDSPVEKVSLAQQGDTVFFEQAEVLDKASGELKYDVVDEIDAILKAKGLLVVRHRMRECSNGNFRSFIGSTDYKPFQTELA